MGVVGGSAPMLIKDMGVISTALTVFLYKIYLQENILSRNVGFFKYKIDLSPHGLKF